jgi:xanthine/uracil permease
MVAGIQNGTGEAVQSMQQSNQRTQTTLESEVPYLVSMALFVSGLGTFVQARTFGPIGSGLLCLQGTSFSFISVILSACCNAAKIAAVKCGRSSRP